MVGSSGAAAGAATGAQQVGPLGSVLVEFESVAVAAAAERIRVVGAEAAVGAERLVAVLEDASAAAAGSGAGGPVAPLSGPALAECAALLARRARDLDERCDGTAEAMRRAAGTLEEADEEVARRVTGTAG